MVPLPTAPTVEAHKTEPDKNTYLVFRTACTAPTRTTTTARTSCSRATRAAPRRLHHPDQPRRRRGAPGDAAGPPSDGRRATSTASTWDPWAQRLLFTTENASAPTYAATPDYPSTVTDLSGSLGRGGYEGIQNDSDGNIWIVEDIGGAKKPGTNAKIPNSFIYRYVPSHPGDLANGKLQVLQVLQRRRRPDHRGEPDARSTARTSWRCTPTAATFDTRWVTIHDTATDGTAPFNANTLAKAAQRHAVQAAGERPVPAGLELHPVLLRRDRRHRCDQPGEQQRRRMGLGVQADPGRPVRRHRDAVAVLQGEPGDVVASTTSASSRGTWSRSSRTPATRCTLSATPSTAAGCSTCARTTRRPAVIPVRWLAEGRDPSATIDSASGRPATTATTRSPASTYPTATRPPAGILGAKVPDLTNGQMALVLHPATRRQLHL